VAGVQAGVLEDSEAAGVPAGVLFESYKTKEIGGKGEVSMTKADRDAMWDGIKIGLIIVTEIAVIVITLSFCPLACMPECLVIAWVLFALGGFGAAHLISRKGKHGR